jgi:hypothetical protein
MTRKNTVVDIDDHLVAAVRISGTTFEGDQSAVHFEDTSNFRQGFGNVEMQESDVRTNNIERLIVEFHLQNIAALDLDENLR